MGDSITVNGGRSTVIGGLEYSKLGQEYINRTEYSNRTVIVLEYSKWGQEYSNYGAGVQYSGDWSTVIGGLEYSKWGQEYSNYGAGVQYSC